jgi:MFS family permease
LTADVSLAGLIMGARMAGVVLAGIVFILVGGRISGQLVMLVMHGSTGIVCAFAFLPLMDNYQLPLNYAVISFLSGMVWSTDFSFRRRMLADRLPDRLVSSGVGMDVMSSHATRLVATLLGGAILGFGDELILLGFLCFLYLGSGIFLLFEKDNAVVNSAGPFYTLRAVLLQARKEKSIFTVLILTPVYNIFVLPYLALIALIFLENFKTTESLAASLASVEGAGAVVGGILISSLTVSRPRIIFVYSTAFFLLLLVLISNSPFIMGLIGMLFFAGMLSSIYSSMQSTLIYQNSIDDLRSPTLSLMTLFIGTGIIGALNVSWMGLYMTVSNVVTVMACEGFVVFLLLTFFLRHFNQKI